MTGIRELWEDRARNMGASCRGVLFKGFAESANAALDAWHKRLVTEIFEPQLSPDSTVLDLGCGYGRLVRVLAERRPDLTVVGQDISLRYCSMVAASGNIAVQGDQSALPFKCDSLGGVLAVTALMYAQRRVVADILLQLRRALRPGAPLLILDPGEELRSRIERIAGRRVATATGGRGFFRDEYRRLAIAAGFHVVAQGGNPRDSLRMLLTLGGKFGWGLACRIVPRDGLSGYSAMALHRWLLLRTPASTHVQS